MGQTFGLSNSLNRSTFSNSMNKNRGGDEEVDEEENDEEELS